MSENDYFIGLDVGTDSVGWAATDSDFKTLRIKGKTAWGSRLFQAANSSQERRSFRSNRRRKERRKYRISLLNELFADEINNIDSSFFLRLEESNLFIEDKSKDNKIKYPLFMDKDKEKQFYKIFPTIWHLRKALIDKTDKNHDLAYSDIRFVYLAIHHIIKYRGNFLRVGDINCRNIDNQLISILNDSFRKIISKITDEDIDDIDYELLPLNKKEELINILSNNNFGITNKKTALKNIFTPCLDKKLNDYIDLFKTIVSGGSYDLKKIYDDLDEPCTIVFNNKYEENLCNYQNIMGDDFEIIDIAKQLFDAIYIKILLSDFPFLCESFVDIYESHKKDLSYLKECIRFIDKSEGIKGKETLYFDIFNNKNNPTNYAAFVSHNSDNKKCSYDDFIKYIRKILAAHSELLASGGYKINDILESIDRGTYLKIIANCSTSIIPHQLHLEELKLILNGCRNKYDFLYAKSNEIIQLFKYKIPYYYGPLNTNSKYSFIFKKYGHESDVITPWNIGNIIDEDKTRTKFINSKLNKCSYLIDETVLPKNSIIYQDYVALNKINGIKNISSLGIKKEIIDILSNHSTMTPNQLQRALIKAIKSKGEVANTVNIIDSLSQEDNFDLSTRYLFSESFRIGKKIGDVDVNINSKSDNADFELVEDIINILEIFSEDRKDAIKFIEKKHHKLSEKQIKTINKYICRGWGRLSSKFLCHFDSMNDDGTINKGQSIYLLMLNNCLVLEQIINDKRFNFIKRVEDYKNTIYGNKSSKEMINEIVETIPPMNRRSVIQAIRIVEEIVKLKKHHPSTIVLEVTRENKLEKKGKITRKRKSDLDDFLNSLKKDSSELLKLSVDLDEMKETLSETDELKLKGKRLYLYFKQLGLDMYTGEKININDIFTDKYDIDHIYPQSIIKDDSLDNMVLVNRESNQKIKKDLYPIPETIRCNEKVRTVWEFLKKKNAISQVKYDRLTRATELSDEELFTFVNRQIVIVNQANIAIRDIFKLLYPNANIILSKAAAASSLRQTYDVPKLRNLNDTHHAVDAYLNIVSGCLLYAHFSSFMLSHDNLEKYNYERILKYKIDKKPDLKAYIQNLTNRHDFLLTYRVAYSDGGFYDQNKVTASSSPALFGSKLTGPFSNTSKYGGFNGLSTAYFVVATIKNNKGKTNNILCPVSILHAKKSDLSLTETYLKSNYCKPNESLSVNYKKIICPYQKVFIKGMYYLLTPSNSDVLLLKPFRPLFLCEKNIKYLSFIYSRRDSVLEKCNLDISAQEVIFNLGRSETFVISKKRNCEIIDEIIDTASKKAFSYCPMIFNISKKENILNKLNVESLNDLSISEQIDIIEQMISIFGRTPNSKNKITTNNFRKSLSSILNDEVSLVFDSVTGLLSKKRKIV